MVRMTEWQTRVLLFKRGCQFIHYFIMFKEKGWGCCWQTKEKGWGCCCWQTKAEGMANKGKGTRRVPSADFFHRRFPSNCQKSTSGIRARLKPSVVYNCRGANFINSQVEQLKLLERQPNNTQVLGSSRRKCKARKYTHRGFHLGQGSLIPHRMHTHRGFYPEQGDNRSFKGSGLAIVRHSLSSDKVSLSQFVLVSPTAKRRMTLA